MEEHRGQLTAILNGVEAGDRESMRRVVPLIYDELRALASRMVDNGRGDTIEPTALVHEAYLKLSDRIETRWKSRAHFYAVAAKVMRQVLLDESRRRLSLKRGGGWRRISLCGLVGSPMASLEIDIARLNEAMHELDELQPRHARIMELRCLVGLSTEATAEVLGVSARTVQREARIARAWLLARVLEAGD